MDDYLHEIIPTMYWQQDDYGKDEALHDLDALMLCPRFLRRAAEYLEQSMEEFYIQTETEYLEWLDSNGGEDA